MVFANIFQFLALMFIYHRYGIDISLLMGIAFILNAIYYNGKG